MRSLKNSVHLIGHIGNTPEINTLENGSKVAKLSIATNDSYTNKLGEKVTQTEWHNNVDHLHRQFNCKIPAKKGIP